ncbi:hypothetical protein MHBO_004566 [Bonamia ostreae]|uniref:Uncharacterized protein n=1 Tax=Bonamia ostreae TaxID=126728 RepID=A0ABV2AUH6_9EUKA
MFAKTLKISKRGYRPYIFPDIYSKDLSVSKSYSLFRTYYLVNLALMVTTPLVFHQMTVKAEQEEENHKEYIRRVEKYIVKPQLEKRKEIEKIAWFYRLDPETESGLGEMKRIVESRLGVTDSMECFNILSKDRPWKTKEEMEFKAKMEKFMAYPNYFASSMKEALEMSEE